MGMLVMSRVDEEEVGDADDIADGDVDERAVYVVDGEV